MISTAPAQGNAPSSRARRRAWRGWVCAALAVVVFRVGRGCGRGGGALRRVRRDNEPAHRPHRRTQYQSVKAHKRGDRAALARVADRMGLVRLSEAIASTR